MDAGTYLGYVMYLLRCEEKHEPNFNRQYKARELRKEEKRILRENFFPQKFNFLKFLEINDSERL